MTKKRILGIDASLSSTGICLMDADTGEPLKYDRIPIKPKQFDGREDKKIHYIATVITNICKEYDVGYIAIENSYVSINGRTGITLSRLHGGITTMLIENGFTLIYDYVPSSWRKTVTGVGNKTKLGVFNWICDNLVDLGEFHDRGKDKNDDIADSIGIAYCLYLKLNSNK